MARPRPTPTPWSTRNARAQARGYRNYYDYRTHDYGRLAPGEQRPAGETRQRLRGHRSAADLAQIAEAGDLVTVVGHSGRDNRGQYTWVEIALLDESSGEERTFRLTAAQLQGRNLERLIDRLEATGVVLSPSPSLDLRRMTTLDSEPGIFPATEE